MSIFFAKPIEQNPWDPITNSWSALNINSAYPASNLMARDLSQVTISTTGTLSVQYLWNMGRAREFDVISVIGTNMTPRATIRIDVSADGNTYTTIQNTRMFFPELSVDPGAAPYAVGTDPNMYAPGKPKSLFLSPTVLSWQYIRIILTDSNNPAGFLSVGRIFVGLTWKPKSSLQYGSSFSFFDTGTRDRTDQGALITMDGYSYYGASVKMDFISSNELYNQVFDFNIWRGSTREILACLDIETTSRLQKNTLYCNVSEGRQISAEQFEAWSQTWVLESY